MAMDFNHGRECVCVCVCALFCVCVCVCVHVQRCEDTVTGFSFELHYVN